MCCIVCRHHSKQTFLGLLKRWYLPPLINAPGFLRTMSSVKRSFDDDSDELYGVSKRQRHNTGEANEASIDSKPMHARIAYPTTSPTRPTAFAYPYQLLSFSYLPTKELVFDNSALKYYVSPPVGADLNFSYDNWIRKPEERGRLDSLLRACLKESVAGELSRASIVSWRGVMTK